MLAAEGGNDPVHFELPGAHYGFAGGFAIMRLVDDGLLKLATTNQLVNPNCI